eukprot:8945690-Lingulodinium_polyedra.AAC.1
MSTNHQSSSQSLDSPPRASTQQETTQRIRACVGAGRANSPRNGLGLGSGRAGQIACATVSCLALGLLDYRYCL